MKDSLGDRMKRNYEEPYRIILPRRMPVIIRLDGKSFHTLLRGAKKPFDEGFALHMDATAQHLYKEVQTTVFAYIQSDEISLLLHNYKRLTTEPYFDNEIQKLASIAASFATGYFNMSTGPKHVPHLGYFDARVFVLPEAEVANYFIWRQKDATRNSISMVAQSLYSHNQLKGKKQSDLQEMIFQKDQNWNDYPERFKRGGAVKNGAIEVPPIFMQDRNYIEELLKVEEE